MMKQGNGLQHYQYWQKVRPLLCVCPCTTVDRLYVFVYKLPLPGTCM